VEGFYSDIGYAHVEPGYPFSCHPPSVRALLLPGYLPLESLELSRRLVERPGVLVVLVGIAGSRADGERLQSEVYPCGGARGRNGFGLIFLDLERDEPSSCFLRDRRGEYVEGVAFGWEVSFLLEAYPAQAGKLDFPFFCTDRAREPEGAETALFGLEAGEPTLP
jgi:hypothetical protein